MSLLSEKGRAGCKGLGFSFGLPNEIMQMERMLQGIKIGCLYYHYYNVTVIGMRHQICVNYNYIMISEEKRNINYTQLKCFHTDTNLIQHGVHMNNIEAVVEYKCLMNVRTDNALVSFRIYF